MKTKESTEIFREASARALEGFSLWTKTDQAILRQSVDFAVKAAAEGTRLFAASQAAGLEVARDGQNWTQHLMRESFDESRKLFGHLTAGGQAVARAAQGVQAAGDAAAVQIRAAVTEAAARVSDLSTAAKG